MIISIGDISIKLDNCTGNELPGHLLPYLINSSHADARCTLSSTLPDKTDRQILYDSNATWRVEQTANGIVLCLLAGDQKERYQELYLNSSLTEGSAFIDASMLNDSDFPFALRMPLLELWYTFMLMAGRGILVHGLGVKQGDSVNIFAGKSGVGKSTLGGVFNDQKTGEILSDDRLIVKPAPPGETGYYVYGTPWHGEARFASASLGKLNRIYFLEHAKECSVSSLDAGTAAAKLFTCCFIAGWPRKSGLQFTLDFCSNLVSEISADTLKFTPDINTLKLLGYV